LLIICIIVFFPAFTDDIRRVYLVLSLEYFFISWS